MRIKSKDVGGKWRWQHMIKPIIYIGIGFILGWGLGYQNNDYTKPILLPESSADSINRHPKDEISSNSLRFSKSYSKLFPDGYFEDMHLEVCDLSSDLVHLQNEKAYGSYPRQFIAGPMQADEMLVVFSLVRSSSVRRILEIGGYRGDSAYNWLQALKCKVAEADATTNTAVYTVDLKPVPKHDHHVVQHTTIIKDAATLAMSDIDNEPVDLLLLDCHHFEASQNILKAVLEQKLLNTFGFIILHDTGMHPVNDPWSNIFHPRIKTDQGVIHQPVERLLADWIPMQDCSFQRVSLHDDNRKWSRHGLTILQRRVPMDFEDCQERVKRNELGSVLFNYEAEHCDEIQTYTQKVKEECPIKDQ